MDNFRFDVTAEGKDALLSAIRFVFEMHRLDGKSPTGTKRGVTHYAIRDAFAGEKGEDGAWKYGKQPRPLRLVFFNHYDARETRSDRSGLPFKLDAEGAADFARRWLEEADYGREPDHDGDNGKGWRVYNESWGHVDDDHNAVIAVSPVWAMYGK